jgi:hypothetical protein
VLSHYTDVRHDAAHGLLDLHHVTRLGAEQGDESLKHRFGEHAGVAALTRGAIDENARRARGDRHESVTETLVALIELAKGEKSKREGARRLLEVIRREAMQRTQLATASFVRARRLEYVTNA